MQCNIGGKFHVISHSKCCTCNTNNSLFLLSHPRNKATNLTDDNLQAKPKASKSGAMSYRAQEMIQPCKVLDSLKIISKMTFKVLCLVDYFLESHECYTTELRFMIDNTAHLDLLLKYK